MKKKDEIVSKIADSKLKETKSEVKKGYEKIISDLRSGIMVTNYKFEDDIAAYITEEMLKKEGFLDVKSFISDGYVILRVSIQKDIENFLFDYTNYQDIPTKRQGFSRVYRSSMKKEE